MTSRIPPMVYRIEIPAKYPINNSGFYRVTGKVVEDFAVPSIEVHTMYKVGYKHRSYENLG